jgi:hypothetical protein
MGLGESTFMDTPIRRLYAAIREGTPESFQGLLGEHPELLQSDGPAILAFAAKRNRIDILEILLAAGVDVNQPDEYSTALSDAARDADVGTAAWLIDHGAAVNAKAAGWGAAMPLHEAVMNGRADMVEFLLGRGADPEALDGERNALALARFMREDDIVALLESRGIAEKVVLRELVDVESESFLALGRVHSADDWFDKTWGDVYRYCASKGLDSLCEKNRVYFLVGYLFQQLADGGIESLYGNPSGEYTPLMADALDRTGSSRAAELVRAINALFPGGAPATDVEERAEQMESLPPEAETLGEQLEAEFDEWTPDGGPRVMVSQLYHFYNR